MAKFLDIFNSCCNPKGKIDEGAEVIGEPDDKDEDKTNADNDKPDAETKNPGLKKDDQGTKDEDEDFEDVKCGEGDDDESAEGDDVAKSAKEGGEKAISNQGNKAEKVKTEEDGKAMKCSKENKEGDGTPTYAKQNSDTAKEASDDETPKSAFKDSKPPLIQPNDEQAVSTGEKPKPQTHLGEPGKSNKPVVDTGRPPSAR